MGLKNRGIGVLGVIWSLAGISVLLAAWVFITKDLRGDKVQFTTPYQMVLLSNGAVYYGKLSDYGTRHPTLTDVYYIVSATNPQTKQVSNVLVKRGKELHAPDRMIINPSHIVFVEPVGTNSKVAELIAQDKKQ